MTIESSLERIALALEANNAKPQVISVQSGPIELTGEVIEKKRGRPPKEKSNPSFEDLEKPKEEQTDLSFGEPGNPASSFLDDEPVPVAEPTLEDVRKAVIDYGKRTNGDKARKLIKDVGGADILVKIPKDKWAAVIAACKGA